MTVQLATKGMISPRNRAFMEGEIQLEANKWQMVTIPVKFGYFDVTEERLKTSKTIRSTVYNYVVQQLETVYNEPIYNLVEVINTYIGDNNFFYNYVPGLTSENSSHNFNLVYMDNDRNEIVPFWIKSKTTFDMVLKWKV